MAKKFLKMATIFKYLGDNLLLAKKVNFMPWNVIPKEPLTWQLLCDFVERKEYASCAGCVLKD